MVRSDNYSIVNLARRELLPIRSHRWLHVLVGLLFLLLCVGCKEKPVASDSKGFTNCIAIGKDAGKYWTAESCFQFEIRAEGGTVLRTTMTPEEYDVISAVVRRMVGTSSSSLKSE